MKLTVTLTVQATYPKETFPETLAAGLGEEVRAHLVAYGLREVAIDIGVLAVSPGKPEP